MGEHVCKECKYRKMRIDVPGFPVPPCPHRYVRYREYRTCIECRQDRSRADPPLWADFGHASSSNQKMSSASSYIRSIRARVKTVLSVQLALSAWGRRVRVGKSDEFLERAVDKVVGAAFGNTADAEFDVDVLNAYVRGLTRAQVDQHFSEAWASMRVRPSRRRAASI